MAESYREDVAGRECHGEDAGKTAVAKHHREETDGRSGTAKLLLSGPPKKTGRP